MSLCRHLSNKYVPYLLAPFFACILGFLIWLPLSASGASPAVIELSVILVFITAGSLTAAYVAHCQARHRCSN